MQTRYDAIIIGAGIGGLTVAALLAKAGRSVLLLESQNAPGSSSSAIHSKQADGRSYHFDLDTSLLSGFQNGGALDWLAQQLAIRFPSERLEPAMQVWLPDRTVTRYGDQRWQEERRRAFPEQADQAERFWKHQEKLAQQLERLVHHSPYLPVKSLSDLIHLLPKLRPSMLALLPQRGRTVGDELRRYQLTDRALRSFIDAQLLASAQTRADQCAWLFGSTSLDLPRQGVYYLYGGAATLAKQLADAFVRDGGDLRYHTAVDSVITNGRRAVAVRTSDGSLYYGDHIVANTTLQHVAELLDNKPLALQKLIAKRSHSYGIFPLYLGLDEAAIPAGLPNHHQVVLDYHTPHAEANTIFISLHPAKDGSRAPHGERALTLSAQISLPDWKDARAKGRDHYNERKAQLSERMLAALERVIPNLSQHIRYQHSGSPVIFEHYTRPASGILGSLSQGSQINSFNSLGPRALQLARLWMVGDSSFSGQNTATITQNGIRVFLEIQAALDWSARRRELAARRARHAEE
jgi:C-3',4' desaturase CrtD